MIIRRDNNIVNVFSYVLNLNGNVLLGLMFFLGLTFANIFMSFMESNWLDECPPDFKSMYYRRYVDDSFSLFKIEDQITHFQNYSNNKHPNV